MIYNNLDIHFQLDETTIKVSKISNEEILHPYPPHSHGKNCFEFHYVASGSGHVHIDKQIYSLKTGSFYITGPNINHSQFSDTQTANECPLCEYGIYFQLVSPSAGKKDYLLKIMQDNPFWIAEHQVVFQSLFQAIFQELKCQNTGFTENIISLLRYMIVTAIRLLPRDSKNSPHLTPSTPDSRKHLLIDELFMNHYKDITLAELSSRLGLSPRQTERLLRTEYGKTFLQKKLEARMSIAQIMLSNKTLSITYISDYLGYSSSEHFSSAFRKYFGITASQYRRQKNI